jgi:hypothetical protein
MKSFRFFKHAPRSRARAAAALGALSAVLGLAAEARAQSYWIDEATDFTGNGCPNDDVNTVTKSLDSELLKNSWTGTRYVNADAYPQDFTESCNSSLYRVGNDVADTRLLTVYAGHGFLEPGTHMTGVHFGFARDGLCFASFANSRRSDTGVMRLGQMNNARAGYSAWITSCSMNSNHLAESVNYQWVNQNFGFDNSPAIEAHQPKDWFRAIGSKSNKNAWLEELEDKQGTFTGDNNPIVVSYSDTSNGCSNMHNDKRLKAQILTPRSGGPSCGNNPPGHVWCATMRSNDKSCG